MLCVSSILDHGYPSADTFRKKMMRNSKHHHGTHSPLSLYLYFRPIQIPKLKDYLHVIAAVSGHIFFIHVIHLLHSPGNSLNFFILTRVNDYFCDSRNESLPLHCNIKGHLYKLS